MRFTEKYVEPEAPKNPLAALRSAMTKHAFDERFLAGARTTVAVAEALHAREPMCPELLGTLVQISRALNAGWTSHEEIRSDVSALQDRILALRNHTWQSAYQAQVDEVMLELEAREPDSVDALLRIQADFDERTQAQPIGHVPPDDLAGLDQIRREAGHRLKGIVRKKAETLARDPNFLETVALADADRLWSHVIGKHDPGFVRTDPASVEALARARLARLPGLRDDCTLEILHHRRSQLSEMHEHVPAGAREMLEAPLDDVARCALGLADPTGYVSPLRAMHRFNMMNGIRISLPIESPSRERLRRRLAKGAEELVDDRLDALAGWADSQTSGFREDIDALKETLLPDLDGEGKRQLDRRIDQAFRDNRDNVRAGRRQRDDARRGRRSRHRRKMRRALEIF